MCTALNVAYHRVHTLGEVTLQGLYPGARWKYSIVLTTVQAVALMCFDSSTRFAILFVVLRVQRIGCVQCALVR
jgi:hypothetical protein